MKFKKVLVIVILMILVQLSIYADDKPRVVILDFNYQNIAEDDARIVSEIFRSKIVISDFFEVLDRNNVEKILEEVQFQISGLTSIEDSVEIGQMLNAQYILTGNFMKLGNNLNMTVSMINVESGKIIGSAETQIPNYDAVYDSITILVVDLINSSLGLVDFTFNTETMGYSIEFGITSALVPVSGKLRSGLGFSLGGSQQTGNFAFGIYTLWTFTNIKTGEVYDWDDEDTGYDDGIILNNLLAFYLAFGDKVTGVAFQVGIGCGYDLALGLNIIPSLGLFYKNLYLRYHPSWNIKVGDGDMLFANQIELGYSFFLGKRGKSITSFRD